MGNPAGLDWAGEPNSPGFVEIASRGYSNEKIVALIHNPQPQNWPDYETAMPPMPQVEREDALKIAAWINSLKED